MMFRRISYRIAWQFTGFVFLLFMFNGGMFFAADIRNAHQMSAFRLERSSASAIRNLSAWPDIDPRQLPPHMRDRIRIVNLQGRPVYSGAFFSDIPFSADNERNEVTVQGEEYGLLTIPLVRKGVTLGFLQVAEQERTPMEDVYRRIVLYLIVSAAVSALTFVVGLYFARRSLKPAEEMMQRLEQFTQDASHELRTPLAALRSSLDLALKTGKLEDGIRSAKEDVTGITRLVERLLELASLDGLTLEKLTMDCTALVRDAVDRHTALAQEKKITLKADVDDAVLADGDSALFKQMLTNLIGNAVKFTPAGGTVTVTLRKNILTVGDTGIGIPESALPKIFNRFYQADSSRTDGGYGLGLALVKRIADLHGWQVAVKSEEKKGTVFTVMFSSKRSS